MGNCLRGIFVALVVTGALGCATTEPQPRIREIYRASTWKLDRSGVVVCRFQADAGVMTCSDPKNAYRMAFTVLEQRELDRMLEPVDR